MEQDKPSESQGMDQADMKSELRLLRHQVDSLLTAAAEKKKPWYRDPSILISATALVLSVVTAITSQIASNEASIQAKHEELRKLLSNIIDLRSDFTFRIPLITNVSERTSAASIDNTKRTIYLEGTETLVSQIRRVVEPSEYITLATEYSYDSKFQMAEQYYLMATDASHDPLSKNIALRAVANFYFMKSAKQDFDKGRRLFQQSVDSLNGANDDYTLYTVGYTFDMWGTAEIMSGFPQEGKQKFEFADKYYSDMSEKNPLKLWAVQAHRQQRLQMEGN